MQKDKRLESHGQAEIKKGLKPLELLSIVPEEKIWLESRQSPHTRRAYKRDVQDFILTFRINSTDEFRRVDHRVVLAWRRSLEEKGLKPTSIRRKLAALSSLFSHLIKYDVLRMNPVRDIERPKINRRFGSTAAFSSEEARALLEAPPSGTTRGLRDLAILSIGLQVGTRRSEIVGLKVRDFHKNMGYWSLHLINKGNKAHHISIHPKTAGRILKYLEGAGHKDDLDGPLFRPCRPSWQNPSLRRHLHPDTIDRILKKYVSEMGLGPGYSAHSMRATFITQTLQNGASLEDVQYAVGHADPQTTKLYDRRRMNPEKSASFFANY